jgi:hypothetical protein
MTVRRAALVFVLAALPAFGAATVRVLNADAPGEGFNERTPAIPVGGNVGTTIGAQRQIAFQHAARLWGQTLTSAQIIRVIALFDGLPCTENSAVLGSAGARLYAFPGVPGLAPDTWYPAALAEKLTNIDIGALFAWGSNFEVVAFFNSSLGAPGCLTGSGWYYGLDTNTPPGQNNLVAVVLHELAHGLGFTAGPTNTATGERALGFPSLWEQHMRDLTLNKSWLDMTNAERAASAVNTHNLVWTGHQTTVDSLQVLEHRPELVAAAPAQVSGQHEVQAASFGPPLTLTGISGLLIARQDTGGASLIDGCESFPAQSISGRIALIDRGTCAFTQKVRNAQAAGAIAVVIANNEPAGLPTMGGSDPLITIPSVGITQALGQALRSLPNLSPAGWGLTITLRRSPTIRAGTSGGFVRLYAPNPLEPGSSVSHYDTSALPNLLMEPALSDDLTHLVRPPRDLTFSLLRDIGW